MTSVFSHGGPLHVWTSTSCQLPRSHCSFLLCIRCKPRPMGQPAHGKQLPTSVEKVEAPVEDGPTYILMKRTAEAFAIQRALCAQLFYHQATKTSTSSMIQGLAVSAQWQLTVTQRRWESRVTQNLHTQFVCSSPCRYKLCGPHKVLLAGWLWCSEYNIFSDNNVELPHITMYLVPDNPKR